LKAIKVNLSTVHLFFNRFKHLRVSFIANSTLSQAWNSCFFCFCFCFFFFFCHHDNILTMSKFFWPLWLITRIINSKELDSRNCLKFKDWPVSLFKVSHITWYIQTLEGTVGLSWKKNFWKNLISFLELSLALKITRKWRNWSDIYIDGCSLRLETLFDPLLLSHFYSLTHSLTHSLTYSLPTITAVLIVNLLFSLFYYSASFDIDCHIF